MPERWTIAEAAAIIAKPAKSLKRAVERAPVKPNMVTLGGRRVYVFEMRDLVFFCALDDLKAGLTAVKQAELFKALKKVPFPSEIGTVEAGQIRYDFKSYVHLVNRNIETVRQRHELIDADGEEPIVKGTDINAYRLAALCDGMTVEEILRDYPSLSEDQVAAAKAFADSYPKPGRPYPKITAKQALRETRADVGESLPTRR